RGAPPSALEAIRFVGPAGTLISSFLPEILMHASLITCLLALGQADVAKYDVVVYSGVPCGIAASVAAARNGASVLLIEPTKHVGGLSTSGINTAESEHMLKWTYGGIALEFYERLGKHYGLPGPDYYFESSVAEKVYLDMLKEANVQVRYGVRV